MILLRPIFALLFGCILFSSIAHAENASEMTDKVCAKVKHCGTQEIRKQGLAPEMENMMLMMFDSMCASIVAPYVIQTKDAGLETMANDCMNSIEGMACDKLINGGPESSESCAAFEKAARDAGIDTNTTNIIQ